MSCAAEDAPMLKLDSAAVFLLTLAFSRQDDRPMGVLILAGTTHFLTFKVFLFSFPYKERRPRTSGRRLWESDQR